MSMLPFSVFKQGNDEYEVVDKKARFKVLYHSDTVQDLITAFTNVHSIIYDYIQSGKLDVSKMKIVIKTNDTIFSWYFYQLSSWGINQNGNTNYYFNCVNLSNNYGLLKEGENRYSKQYNFSESSKDFNPTISDFYIVI